MPVIIQLTLEDGHQRFVNANKILFFNRSDNELTWLDIEDGGFYVKETPEEIDSKIDDVKIYIARA
jgi:hypothetical protein